MPNGIKNGIPRRRQICLAVAVIGATAAATACGSSSSVKSTGAAASTAVSIGTNADPAAFGYDPAALSGGGETTFWQGLYSSLFTTTSVGAVEPQLATSYTFNADKTVLTLQLRQGVKFTDGTTLTSTLVKQNLDRRSDPTLGAYGMFAAGGTAAIVSVAAPSPSTVVITFAKSQASAPSLLADDAGRIVGGKAIANPKSLMTQPDGSGPYTLSASGTVKGSSYTLAKNTSAWDASSFPYSRVVFKVLQDSQTMANALVSGQVQVAQLDPSVISFVKSKDSVVEFAGTIYASPLFDKLGKTSEPFASVKVRQALSMAVNRAAIAKLHPGAVATASFFPPGTQGYDSNLDTTYAYNPAKAKRLLAEAGYPHGFSFSVITVGPQMDTDLQALQQDWQAIDVHMTIQHATSYAEGLQAQSTTPIGYNDFTIGRDPLGFVNAFLLGGTFNPQHATDAQITSALQVAESEGGNSDTAALKSLDDAVVNEGWMFTFYAQPAEIGYDSSQVQVPKSSGASVFPLLSSVAPAGA
ncbi:ABC transporter substrate-binding protein [Trebonia kvetii]|nr:ABC transporter substrate-binding protein [Trebonia kvetii]